MVNWLWGDCLKCLKRRWNNKKGCINNNFRKRDMFAKVVDALKMGRDCEPLTNYAYFLHHFYVFFSSLVLARDVKIVIYFRVLRCFRVLSGFLFVEKVWTKTTILHLWKDFTLAARSLKEIEYFSETYWYLSNIVKGKNFSHLKEMSWAYILAVHFNNAALLWLRIINFYLTSGC